ncbi:TIGR02450 family Trp-rich protein [Undibacterium sp. Rencai35W]|uniref:TIGR02450 family Trp-rich protein n=1 Tax=Undibacterium sp. Rencai35W TaxID=3413046 RepID=UPI003BF2AD5D
MSHLNPKKLLLSKWTAAKPENKEKHFIVTKLIEPETPDTPDKPCELIIIEAVHSGNSRTIPWKELTDTTKWLQGWK